VAFVSIGFRSLLVLLGLRTCRWQYGGLSILTLAQANAALDMLFALNYNEGDPRLEKWKHILDLAIGLREMDLWHQDIVDELARGGICI